ncbi:MAG: nucleoside deaminase [Desulfohalobiaceae bacterium]|nr:nucleoside deaminase [Desulfohalobiaceae bacterium]
MSLALEQARTARDQGEVPVGAVLLDADGSLLARSGNQPLGLNDPTAHAEILALRQASEIKGNYRLPGTLLVCTLEPCLMCLGALTQARIEGLVFGTRDPRSGAIVSRLAHPADLPWLNHYFWWREGVRAEECGSLLRAFFNSRR